MKVDHIELVLEGQPGGGSSWSLRRSPGSDAPVDSVYIDPFRWWGIRFGCFGGAFTRVPGPRSHV